MMAGWAIKDYHWSRVGIMLRTMMAIENVWWLDIVMITRYNASYVLSRTAARTKKTIYNVNNTYPVTLFSQVKKWESNEDLTSVRPGAPT